MSGIGGGQGREPDELSMAAAHFALCCLGVVLVLLVVSLGTWGW